MSRLMSVAMTTDAVIERRKTVTRRKGWWLDKNGRRLLKPGDTLTLCRKVQGRKPGEPIERLAEVQVVDVRREPLCAVGGPYAFDQNGRYLWPEVIAEGFPDMSPEEFMRRFFFDAQRISAMDDVTRIAWVYLNVWCDGTPHSPAAIPPLPYHDWRYDADNPWLLCARCGAATTGGVAWPPPTLDAAWFAREEALLSQVAALHDAGVPMREACLRTFGEAS